MLKALQLLVDLQPVNANNSISPYYNPSSGAQLIKVKAPAIPAVKANAEIPKPQSIAW